MVDEEEEESTTEDDVEEDDVPTEGNYGLTADLIANPTSGFQRTIGKWTITKGCMNVPKLFARSIGMMQNKTVKLRNGTGDSWLAKLQVENIAGANKPPDTRFVFTCLFNFLRENNLDIGDKCTFELAQPSTSSQDLQHVVIDVVFDREGKQNSPRSNEFNQHFKSQFQLTLTRWNLTRYSMVRDNVLEIFFQSCSLMASSDKTSLCFYYQYVPLSFARSNDMMRSTIVKLQDGTGDSWLARLIVSNYERANKPVDQRVSLSISAEFLRDNDLKVGDTCIFKLVQPSTRQEEVVMDVVVLRKP